jgi:hypothetical protein
VLGGGAEIVPLGLEYVALSSSQPAVDGTYWVASAVEVPEESYDWLLRVYAICADVGF